MRRTLRVFLWVILVIVGCRSDETKDVAPEQSRQPEGMKDTTPSLATSTLGKLASVPARVLVPTPTPLPTATSATAMPTLVVTAISTSTPTAEPSVTPTVTATQPKTPLVTAERPTTAVPRILSFTAEPVEVDPGQTVQLSWKSTGGVTATIEQRLPADLTGPFLSVSPSGNVAVTIEEDERYWHEFKLVVANEAGDTVKQKVSVQIRCPYAYFFSSAPTEGWGRCPARPAALTLAAEQLFEGGRVVWLQEIAKESTRSGLASEGPLIFVFYEDGRWLRFEDTWTAAEPEQDPDLVPSPGMVQPVRGFGKVWRNNPQVREALGWALAPEQAFEGAYQLIWVPYYFSRSAYMRAADGRILLLDANGYWDFYRP